MNGDRRVAELERLVGKQQALIAFFENALQQVEAGTVGKAASTRLSGNFANEPGATLTVEEMCREAGVSRAGFYRHWRQREPSYGKRE